MFIPAPKMNARANALEMPKMQAVLTERSPSITHESSSLLQHVLEELIDGILVLTEQREVIHANDCARRILRLLNRGKPQVNLVPQELWHLCRALIESRHQFPGQHWVMESKIFIDSSIAFHVRARWLKLETFPQPCLLLIMQDQYQSIRTIALEEAIRYGLTCREKEIWLLHRANYTYKQISAELHITPNTVKKHMKSIHVKQREALGDEA